MTQDIADTAAGELADPPEFPMRRDGGCPFDPPSRYKQLRDEGRVIQVRVPTGQTAWLVTRYDDVRRLLTDPLVSADRRHPNMPLTEEVTPQTRANIAEFGRSLIGLDQPEHGPRRRMLIPEFTVRRIQALRPHIQHTVDGLIDDMLAGPKPADLATVLSTPVPARTLCELLGMPYEDRELIERTAAAQLRRSISPQERQQVSAEMYRYVDQLITAKEKEPTDDLLGRLVLRNRETGLYDHRLLVGLAMLLLVAGFETTNSMISLGVIGLLQHPEQAELIRKDPAAVGPAVDELLRYFTVVDALPRVLLGDVQVGDVTMRAGDGLLISFAGADWDDRFFAEPEQLDITRTSRHHVAFGYGIHQCIGQNLARAELEIVLRTLFTRVPTLRLAEPMEALPFRDDTNIFGVDRVPVTW
ncbi:cytochrome P450 [Dactylosporangium sp. NPDC051485]|uniref:cytochrome P450 n=1 Tax=Dactylosporangium sp. NPDC051485 TaxID=3154846 RepID=UPI003436D4FB